VIDSPQKGEEIAIITGYVDDIENRYSDNEKLYFFSSLLDATRALRMLNDYY
jgi:hypothetical protein